MDVVEENAVTATAAGSPVPCQSGRPARTALPPDYQPIISVLEAEARLGRDRTRAKELAMALGLEAVPAKIEGVRSRAKRLAERGWITGHQSEKFSIVTP